MKTIRSLTRILTGRTAVVAALLALALPLGAASPTAFTYQGRLKDDGVLVSGTYDLRFRLHDEETGGGNVSFYDANSVLVSALTNAPVYVTNGVFSVTLDFGSRPFTNNDVLWLGVAVRTNGSTGNYVNQSPRFKIAAVPYAVRAAVADAAVTANSLSGTVSASQVSGTLTAAQLADGAITSDKLAAGSVTSTALAAGSVGYSQLAPNALSGDLISDGVWTRDGMDEKVTVTFRRSFGSIPSVSVADSDWDVKSRSTTGFVVEHDSSFDTHLQSGGSDTYIGTHTSSAVLPDGSIGLAFYDDTENVLKYRRWDVATKTWTTKFIIGETQYGSQSYGQYCNLKVIGGKPVIAYRNLTTKRPNLAYCSDSLGDISNRWTIVTNLCATNTTTIEIGRYLTLEEVDGRPLIVSQYTNTLVANSAALIYSANFNSSNNWSHNWLSTSLAATNPKPRGVVALPGAYSRPGVAFEDQNSDNLGWIYFNGSGATTNWRNNQIIVPVDTSVNTVGAGGKAAIINGHPAISYYDTTSGDLKYAYSSTATGSAGSWTLVTVDSSNDGDLGTSLAVVGGTPAIAYHDNVDRNLRYAYSTDANGAAGTWSTKLVYSTDDAGMNPWLTEFNGGPFITSYYTNATQGKILDVFSSLSFLDRGSIYLATNGTPYDITVTAVQGVTTVKNLTSGFASVGVGTYSPAVPLHVVANVAPGSTTEPRDTNHVVIIENTNTNIGASGLAIKLRRPVDSLYGTAAWNGVSAANNYITFYKDVAEGVFTRDVDIAGRIEGISNKDLYDTLVAMGLKGSATEILTEIAASTYVGQMISFAKLGVDGLSMFDFDPGIKIETDVSDWFSYGDLPSLSINWSGFSHNWDKGELPSIKKSPVSFSTPSLKINGDKKQAFLDDIFDMGDKAKLMWDIISDGPNMAYQEAYLALEGSGVTYESGSGDYAEWLERLDHNEKMKWGEIVGVVGGKITKQTEGADQLLVISRKPIVLGNMPVPGKEKVSQKVAFMGQVPVKVTGFVAKGDYIVASGNNDGLGRPVKRESMTIEQLSKVVGVAWSEKNTVGTNYVRVAVGLRPTEMINVAQQQAKVQEALKAENVQLRSELAEMKAQMALFAASLKNVETLVASTRPANDTPPGEKSVKSAESLPATGKPAPSITKTAAAQR
ncbi:MAG: hypothetical protein HZA89_06860 [Verrucomicrobia bacterium]|nr:hypothetical protein [Verrucomicrobiota bacterium]